MPAVEVVVLVGLARCQLAAEHCIALFGYRRQLLTTSATGLLAQRLATWTAAAAARGY